MGGSGPLMVSAANDPLIHHGVWKVRVSYWKGNAIIGMPSELGEYLHGPPVSAPTGFTAHNAGPDARRLVWDAVTGTSYDTRYTADATDDDEWTDWKMMSTSGMVVDDLDMGVEYTFELRARGASRAGVGDLHGPSASITEMIPVPTPPPPPVTDLAQVLGVGVAPGNAQLVVTWTAVDTATGYTVQWTSGGQGYNTGDRQATVTPGSTTSHTIEGLANGTEYTVRVIATRTDANDGPPSAEVTGTTEMIPVPTPTLPEIALLLLAMLLLGSGVYLLRGRQSGGLTHA